jgi:hypothetical protein
VAKLHVSVCEGCFELVSRAPNYDILWTDTGVGVRLLAGLVLAFAFGLALALTLAFPLGLGRTVHFAFLGWRPG